MDSDLVVQYEVFVALKSLDRTEVESEFWNIGTPCPVTRFA